MSTKTFVHAHFLSQLCVFLSVFVFSMFAVSAMVGVMVHNPSAHKEQLGLGETVTVTGNGAIWPCGSTPEAFDEMSMWADPNQEGLNQRVLRMMRLTGSFALQSGMRVNLVEARMRKSKVRVLT